ncbi:EamA family transporter [Streptomyces sp. RFCAC02]|uniref:EamA family transporter n=1 Tax=Streptomyces sp. RFCAC02 TaxID=2499143 RepID=UPI0010218567|nr:EamA family transporter [Streptomyces sp. RFCAC02]
MTPALLVLGQIVSIQLGSAVAKGAYDQAGPMTLAGMRLAFAALALWVVARPRPRRLTREQWRAAAGLGLTIAVMNAAYFSAIERLPLGVAATLELLGPLLLAVALSRRPAHLAAALLAIGGVLLLAAPGGSLPAAGVAFAATAALCRAVYVSLNGRVGRLFDDWSGLAVALAIGAVLMTPVAAATGGRAVVDHPSLLGPGCAVALLSSLIPYSLDMAALRRIGPRTFGVLLSLGPAVGAGVGLVFLDEELSARQMCAVALVVAAAAWSVAQGRPAPARGPVASSLPVRPTERCPVCMRPGGGEWTLRSRHRTSEGETEYCATPGGCLVVMLDGRIVKHVSR